MRARIPFGIPIVTSLVGIPSKEADMVYFSRSVYIHNGTTWVPVGDTNLADGSVTTPKLADLAVTAPKIADFAVTNAKLFGNIEPSKLQSQVGFSLIGNSFPGVSPPHVITIGSGLSFVGSELRATGSGGIPEAPNDGSDYVRNSAGWVLLNWTSLDGKPSTFAPSAHTHPWSDITGTPVTLAGYGITDAAPLSHVGAGGGAHANATISVAGFMSGADKTKLDGVANNANNYVHPNHTGDVTSTGDGATVIAADAVTNAKLANVSTSTVKGRVSGGVGDPEDLTTAQLTTLVDQFTTSLKGAAPASGGGTTNYLRADGTWAVPPGGAASNSFATVTITDTDSGFSWSGTGSVVADSSTDTITYVSGAGINVDVDAASDAVRFTAVAGGIDHNSLLNYVANQHIDHSAVTISTTSPLTGGGTIAANRTFAIATNGISNALFRQSNATSVVGRSAGTVGDVSDIVASGDGQVLRQATGVLGFGQITTASISDGIPNTRTISTTSPLTGGGDLSANRTFAIAANGITNALIRQGAATSVIGRSAGTTGDVADIAASANGQFLQMASGTLSWGTITSALITDFAEAVDDRVAALVVPGTGISVSYNDGANTFTISSSVVGISDGDKGDITVSGSGATWTIDSNAVSDAKIRDSVGNSVIGRSGGTTGDPADIVASGSGHVLRLSGSTLGFGLIDLSSITNITDNRFIGRIGGAGPPIELTGTNATNLLDVFTTSLKGLAPASGGGVANFLRADGTWAPPPGTVPSDLSTSIQFSGDITPTALVSGSTNNDYNPAGLSSASTLRLSIASPFAASEIRGLADGADGRILTIHNIGTNGRIVIRGENASSTAANRFVLGNKAIGLYPDRFTLLPGGSLVLQYDSTASRWRILSSSDAVVRDGFVSANNAGEIDSFVGSGFFTRGELESTGTATISIGDTSSGFGAILLKQDFNGERHRFEINAAALQFGGVSASDSPASDQNNYNPSDLDKYTPLFLTPSASISITGLEAPLDGATKWQLIHNQSSSNSITLVGESTSSTAANRFSETTVLPPYGTALLVYNGFRWGCVSGAKPLEDPLLPVTVTLTANENDWNPSGLYKAGRVRISLSANYSIGGIAGGVDGRVLILQHVGATNRFTLNIQDASSAAANRIAATAAVAVFPDQCATLMYDGISSRWRLLSFI